MPFLRVFLADKTISPENGDASRRLAGLIEDEVLAKEPHASLDVPLAAYLENGSNYETVRLIALSDRVYGQGRELRRAVRLRAGGDPRAARHVRARRRRRVLGVPDAGSAARGRPAAGADRARGAAADLRGRRGDASEPAGARAGRGRAVRLRLVRVRLHRLVHARRSLGGLGRHGTAGALPRDRRARFAPGTPISPRARESTSSRSS